LVELELADSRLDPRYELDRGGSGPDDGDALAAQLVRVLPSRRMEPLPGERLESGERRIEGSDSAPTPSTRTPAARESFAVSIAQRSSASSHAAAVTGSPKRM
jgi:hypothetical protein